MKNKVSLAASLIACLTFGALHAQQNKVVSAKMYLDDYNSDKTDTADLEQAKEAIDLAAVNDKTKDEPKMWLFRGNVYFSIFEKNLSTEKDKLMKGPGKPSDKEALMGAYAAIDTTPVCIAAYSYMQVIKIEPDKSYADDARLMLPRCAAHIENKATSDFSNQKYPSALAMFERAISIGHAQGFKDTADFIVQNTQNCAITADKMHDYPQALHYYQQLVDLKVGGAEPYTAIKNIYTNMKDTAGEIGIIRKGRAAYPDDVNLLIAETNYYMQTGKINQAINNLQTVIDKVSKLNDTSNNTLLSELYFALGNTFDRMANPKNDSGRALPKPANYNDLFTKAETNYKKALTFTPNSFDQNYDLGALYNNRATVIDNEANNVPPADKEQFNKLQAEANGYLKEAQPWLEKAHTINPHDQATISALIQIYSNTNQTDKIKPLREGK